MTRLEGRIKELERFSGSGKVVVVKLCDDDYAPLPEVERQRKLEAARAEAGPSGEVITIEYVDDWRGAHNGQP